MTTEILKDHLYENALRDANKALSEHTRETAFEVAIRECFERPLRHISKPVAALFEPGKPEHGDLLLVNNGAEVWEDERFEGAALNALDRLRDSVRKVVEAHMDDYLSDFGHSLAGVLMAAPSGKKKPRKAGAKRG